MKPRTRPLLSFWRVDVIWVENNVPSDRLWPTSPRWYPLRRTFLLIGSTSLAFCSSLWNILRCLPTSVCEEYPCISAHAWLAYVIMPFKSAVATPSPILSTILINRYNRSSVFLLSLILRTKISKRSFPERNVFLIVISTQNFSLAWFEVCHSNTWTDPSMAALILDWASVNEYGGSLEKSNSIFK